MSQKKIILLGATGSIGKSTLQVIEKHSDKLSLLGIAAHKNTEALSHIAQKFSVPHIAITDEASHNAALKSSLFNLKNSTLYTGPDSLEALATLPEADIILVATSSIFSLNATLSAIKQKKTIALANKETLILGGPIIMAAAKKFGAKILPVDSEHSALFQCLENRDPQTIKKLILTASGGAFKNLPINDLRNVTLQDALKHPTWDMGPKITIDCATLANKSLELFEAHWLFDIPAHKIDAVLHPQSIIHSFVEFIDGSILSQLSPTSMTFPIQYALLYPSRAEATNPVLSFENALNLEIKPIDLTRYPTFKLAKDALHSGHAAQIIFNASNDIAVQSFMNNEIPFLGIHELIDLALDKLPKTNNLNSLEEILALDTATREFTQAQISQSPSLL